MRVVLQQCNSTVGAITDNLDQYRQLVAQASCDLMMFPELALCGYPPEDYLFHGVFHQRVEEALSALADVADIPVIIGAPCLREDKIYNAAYLLHRGRYHVIHCKTELPNTQVFDEKRYFEPGDHSELIDIDGVRIGVMICRDGWHSNVASKLKAMGAAVLIQINASPYAQQRQQRRIDVARARVRETGLPLLTVNLVGGQDELVFDGQSFGLNADGSILYQAAAFKPASICLEFKGQAWRLISGQATEQLSEMEMLYQALVLGVRDYVCKNKFDRVVLGLSGGIDSALTLAIAVDALGADKVRAVLMPSPYTAQMSIDDAIVQCDILKVAYDIVPIDGVFEQMQSTLAPMFDGTQPGLAEENLQARIRGNILMALSNKFGSLVLTTSNKSEVAVGYSTLYGDMAGGFNVLKDVWKTQVYALAKFCNRHGEIIPSRVITRPPSAELRHDQTDQDSLPDYDTLDGMLRLLIEHNVSAREIVAAGYDAQMVGRMVRLVRRNEYKRRQSPPGPRVSMRAFGKDWRYPIISGFEVKV